MISTVPSVIFAVRPMQGFWMGRLWVTGLEIDHNAGEANEIYVSAGNCAEGNLLFRVKRIVLKPRARSTVAWN